MGFESLQLEGYGPGGAALVIECLTSDRARTAAEIRRILADHGGQLGAPGAVTYLFNPVGVLTYPAEAADERLAQVAYKAGAEDVVNNPDHSVAVLTDPLELDAARVFLTERGFPPARSEVTQRAALSTALSGEAAKWMIRLLATLRAREDVRNVYTNAEMSSEITRSTR